MVMAATGTDVSTGHRKGAEIRGTTACGQTVREKSRAALHPIHCVTVMAATWTDAPADHGEGRKSPARRPMARRCARKSDAALHPMHCVSGAAIPVRLALLGARYGLCEPLVSPFAPRKNETFAERKATNFAKAISDDPFESAGVVGEATALLNSKIKAGNFLVKVQEVRLKQEAAARNAIEARTKAMEEYRTQFVDHAAALRRFDASRGGPQGGEEGWNGDGRGGNGDGYGDRCGRIEGR